MSYAIVSEHQGVTIFNLMRTAASALALAVERRQSGARAVFVRDEEWALVAAVDLERAAAREQGDAAVAAEGAGAPFRVGGTGEADAPRSGRVRVFKAGVVDRKRD